MYTRAQNGENIAAHMHAHAERMDAAILFADVSGFTALTETLSRQSSTGAEELTSLLNLYFTRMITHIESYRGQVVRLSGDAITAIFRVDDLPDHTLTSAMLYAMYAAIDMQIAMIDFQHITTSVGEASLALKIGIGASNVVAAHIGGVFERWEYLVAGDAIEQASFAEKHARPGMVMLSPQAGALLSLTSNEYNGCVPVMSDDQDSSVLLSLNDSPYARPYRSLPMFLEWDTIPNERLEKVEQLLRHYVPAAISRRMLTREQAWLAELRRMTVMFVGIGGLDYDDDDETIRNQLQTLLSTTQKVIYRYEGSLNKIAVDDKGTVLLILFGAPPLAHEDDPVRALACAQEMHQIWSSATQPTSHPTNYGDDIQEAQNLNLRLAIGITTDTVFAGPVGSPSQCEYTVMGDAVNLASRLMQAANIGDTFCDQPTYNEVRRHWSLEALPPMLIRGKAKPVRVYRFSGLRSITQFGDERPMVGRDCELATLMSYLDKVVNGFGAVVSLIGEGGMGKTRMLYEFMAQEKQRETATLTLMGTTNSIGQQTPYIVWREVLIQYFGLERRTTLEQRTKRVVSVTESLDPELVPRLPLLNEILDLGMPETPATRVNPRQRRDSLTFLIVQLLQEWAKKSPLIVLLDDMHWADMLSWELALDVARIIALQPIMLILSYRPPENNDDITWRPEKRAILDALTRLGQHYPLHLNPMDKTAVESLTVASLDGQPVAENVVNWIVERSQGNPFFVEETVRMLHEQSALVFDSDGVWLLKGEYGLTAIPSTLKGIIQAHLDRLHPSTQLTCKVASVVGRIFPERVLEGIYPMREEVANLRDHLNILAEQNITPLESYEPEVRYQFKSALTQDVAYNSLLLTQRQSLHLAVAEWYEREYASNLDPYVPLLAEHYRHTDEWHRFLYFTERAGQLAAANYATVEALSYLSEAIDLLKKRPGLFDEEDQLKRLFSLISSRAEVYEHSSNTTELEQDLEELRTIAEKLESPRHHALTAIHRGRYYQTIDDYASADKAIRQAIKYGKKIKDHALLGESMNLLARNSELRADYYQALWWGLQAMEYCREVGDKAGEARSLNLLGIAYGELGDYTQSKQYHQQALEIRRAIEDRWGEATSLYHIGALHNKLSKPREALEVLQEVLALRKSIGDRSGEAFTLLNIGNAYQSLGDLNIARSYQDEALTIWRELGNQYGEATLLIDMSDIATALGDFESAQRYATEAKDIARTLGNRQIEAYSLAKWGNASRELASYQHRKQAPDQPTDHDHNHDHDHDQDLKETLTTMASRVSRIASQRRSSTQPTIDAIEPLPLMAKQHHRAAHKLARELGLKRLEAYALHHLGEWEWEWGSQDIQERAAVAAEHWQQAETIREEIGEMQFFRATRCRRAYALAIQDKLDDAHNLLEEVWAIWGKHPPSGEDEDELREGYMAMYQTWKLLGDEQRAGAALAWAYQGIQDRAVRISDPAVRDSFLNRVSINYAIIEAWEKELEEMM
jgi:predicted ATPase/class 3 adenylate cyclase